MRYHYKPIKMVKIKKKLIGNAGQATEKQEYSIIAVGNAKWYLEDSLAVPYKAFKHSLII